MRRGDPDIVRKLAKLLGHRKLAQTYHYLDGLLKIDGPNDAAKALAWGSNVDGAFVVAAAAKAVDGATSTAVEQLVKVDGGDADEAPLATVYPIHIGRPRKAKPAVSVTPNSSPDGATAIAADKKR